MKIQLKEKRILLEKNEEDSEKEITPFENLDLNKTLCFGYSFPMEKSWKSIAEFSIDQGWSNVDVQQLQKNLAKNIVNSYSRIAQFELTNLDDDMKYVLYFDNNKGLWNLQLKHSPKATIEVEERANFFKSEMFKKISQQTFFLLKDSYKIYMDVVDKHVSHGEFLLIDEVKLSAILHFLEQKFFLDNIKNGKYLSY